MKDNLKLLQGFKKADVNALDLLFDAYYEWVADFACRIIHDEHFAQDLALEAFEQVWAKRDTFEEEWQIRGLLFVYVRNRAYNYLETLRYKNTIVGISDNIVRSMQDTAPGIDEWHYADSIAKIRKIVEQLPDKQKEVFYLYYNEGKSPNEIAEQMGITPSTVRTQKQKVLEQIRKELGDQAKYLDVELLLVISLLLLEEHAAAIF
jgi:RNA polymerase sigma-70 factor (ECF subfamily)